ncbi:hypothetical protein BJV78DRAFT_1151824 [Lactifluus subvellereus]|nr:hypothetical protein BJV78DRAFT_1151824 [Lactifluus subvellereus]
MCWARRSLARASACLDVGDSGRSVYFLERGAHPGESRREGGACRRDGSEDGFDGTRNEPSRSTAALGATGGNPRTAGGPKSGGAGRDRRAAPHVSEEVVAVLRSRKAGKSVVEKWRSIPRTSARPAITGGGMASTTYPTDVTMGSRGPDSTREWISSDRKDDQEIARGANKGLLYLPRPREKWQSATRSPSQIRFLYCHLILIQQQLTKTLMVTPGAWSR